MLLARMFGWLGLASVNKKDFKWRIKASSGQLDAEANRRNTNN